jgi:hypothetical protein
MTSPLSPDDLTAQIDSQIAGVEQLLRSILATSSQGVLGEQYIGILKTLYAARSGAAPPDQVRSSQEPRGRFVHPKTGKGIDPIKAIRILFRDHGKDEMPTQELFALLESGGAFKDKGDSVKSFKQTITQNVNAKNIRQKGPDGVETGQCPEDAPPFAGSTILLKK